MKWTFRIVTSAVALSLFAGAAVVLRPQPLDVDVAKVEVGPLDQRVVSDGRARVRERYTVSAPVAGSLARIDLHEGDTVEPGTVLAHLLPLASPLLDPESRKASEQRLASSIDASEQSKSTVLRAQIADEEAKTELARVDGLAKKGAVTEQQLDQAKAESRMRTAELASAKFSAKVSEHEIGQARAALARFTPGATKSEQIEITSPVHGQVLHVLRKSEGVVVPGAALLEIGDPAALELVADVLSQDAVQIKPGMVARIVHWGGDASLPAKVRRVEPAAFTKTSALGVEEERVNVVLDIDGPPDLFRALGDGFAVQVEIVTWSKPDAMQIPTSALFRSGSQWEVFTVDRGQAMAGRVRPGHRGPLQTEIAQGLGRDDVVIIHPGAGVRNGSRVTYR